MTQIKKTIKKLLNKRVLFRMLRIKNSFLFSKNKKRGKVDELFVIYDFFVKNHTSGIMFDVGVHFGESSIPFLRSGWEVYGFEPDKNNFEIVERNISENISEKSKFHLFDFALADKPGKLNFYKSEESSGISSLLNFQDSHKSAYTVKVSTLNDVIEEFSIPPVKLIKVDAEGYDLLVLKGLDLIKHNSVEIIMCEYEDKKTVKLGYTVLDMVSYLQSAGFNILICEWEPIVQYGGNHQFRSAKKFPCSIDHNCWGNIIAYKDPEFEKFALQKMN